MHTMITVLAFSSDIAAAIPCNATSVTLTGTTTGGQAFEGTDASIRIVGCK